MMEIIQDPASSLLAETAKMVDDGLSRPSGEKTIPTILLYDERGLRLYDIITTDTPDYYLFRAEEQILKDHADEIIKIMRGTAVAGERVLELGAGALRKTLHILLALARSATNDAPITYYALDLEKRELERALTDIHKSVGTVLQGKVVTKGICGTYNAGLKYITRFVDDPESLMSSANTSTSESQDSLTDTPSSSLGHSFPPLHILFLGSSLGNFTRPEAVEFLRGFPLRSGSRDTLLIGLDHDNNSQQIEAAYNNNHTENFIKNGLRVVGRVLGNENLFDKDNWEYVSKYDSDLRVHEAFLKAKLDHSVAAPNGKIYTFGQNEKIKIEHSYKFSGQDTFSLFTEANLRPVQQWSDNDSQYSLWLLQRPPFAFPLLSPPSAYKGESELVSKKVLSTSSYGIPARQDWNPIWKLWDFVTLRMIPPFMLLEKPIDLRHICLFYLGHIPAFLDIHLSRLLNEPFTQPKEYKNIFERGIDPDVDDPTQCNPHSEVPTDLTEWPALSDIVDYQRRVRSRLISLYDDIESGKRLMTKGMGRVLFMTLEHEGMHAETLLYMLLQRAGTGTIPPPDFSKPDWESLATTWNAALIPDCGTVILGPETITIGHDDDEQQDVLSENIQLPDDYEYGWDNENPKRIVEVQEFEISWQPVTNGEYYDFYSGHKDKVNFPASWILEDDIIQVRTLYGPVPMTVAQRWPMLASYDNFLAYAIEKGGRLPTEPELRLFYDKFRHGYEEGANIGFRNWHPLPATTGGTKDGGRGCNGGIWEWTSTVLDKVDGYTPSNLYPGYSADFFDGKHNVVIGGSYATVPRIAERRSFRNWYQRNYPYPWVGARIAYDKN